MDRHYPNKHEKYRAQSLAHLREAEDALKHRQEAMLQKWVDLDQGWEDLRGKMTEVGLSMSSTTLPNTVLLNVGGLDLHIPRSVLEDMQRSSAAWTLADLIGSGVSDEIFPRDSDGNIVLDESPACVEHLIKRFWKRSETPGASPVLGREDLPADELTYLPYVSCALQLSSKPPVTGGRTVVKAPEIGAFADEEGLTKFLFANVANGRKHLKTNRNTYDMPKMPEIPAMVDVPDPPGVGLEVHDVFTTPPPAAKPLTTPPAPTKPKRLPNPPAANYVVEGLTDWFTPAANEAGKGLIDCSAMFNATPMSMEEHEDDLHRFGASIAESLKAERTALHHAQAELQQANARAAASRNAVAAVYGPGVAAGQKDPVVELSVRGPRSTARITTLLSTLQVCPDSVLARRFNSSWTESKDAHGRSVITDCTPTVFSKVLDVLRMRKRVAWAKGIGWQNGVPCRVTVRQADRESFLRYVNMYFVGCETFITDVIQFQRGA